MLARAGAARGRRREAVGELANGLRARLLAPPPLRPQGRTGGRRLRPLRLSGRPPTGCHPLGVWAVCEGAALVLLTFERVHGCKVMIHKKLRRLLKVLPDVPQDAPPAAGVDVQFLNNCLGWKP